jgi:arylsulfatase A-like enzyme
MLLLPVVTVVNPTNGPAFAETPLPNVVVIVTDDQPKGTMDAMKAVREQIVSQGVTLNGVIPTSTCCPSRVALLSGKYARTTGVYRNVQPHGGWPDFYESGAEAQTIAVALNDAGYRTGLFGKYLNGYGLAPRDYVPPGWDDFRAIYDPTGRPRLFAGAYYNYFLHGTGDDVWYGDEPRDYSTDVIASESVRFVNQTPSDQPLFLFFSTTGPHAPFTPARRHIGDWHNEKLSPAAYTLTKNRPAFWPDTLVNHKKWVARQTAAHEALLSVDEGFEAVYQALGDRVQNTLFVYLSDNGLQYGEHGLTKKYTAYSGSTNVPMYVRWDGAIPPGTASTSPMTNADLTATIADAAGVSLGDLDGVSLFADQRPTGVTLEAIKNSEHPAYCGYRSKRYLYVEYDAGDGREFYDYRRDPHELVNAIRDDRYDEKIAEHRALVRQTCFPTPPGFSW